MGEDQAGKRGAKGGGSPEEGSGEAARKARLAAALRANLQRRKAQARGRAEQEPETPLNMKKDGEEPPSA